MSEQRKTNYHIGHRERVRERYFKNGFAGFPDHELLEALLYHSISRRDTNPIAHAVLDRFGSVRDALNATDEEWLEIDGIGDSSVFLKSLILELMRRYEQGKLEEKVAFHSLSRIVPYFVSLFRGIPNERLYLMLLNNRMHLIDCVLVSEGSVSYTEASVRRINELALQKRASFVVVAHNHPNGLAFPSSNDIEMTDVFFNYFEMIGIRLMEHLVIADDHFFPIIRERLNHLQAFSAGTSLKNPSSDDFYDLDYKVWKAPSIFDEPEKK